MKPVAIFRFGDTEGPGHFATFLEANRVPWTLVALDKGDAVPPSSAGFSGLGFMGGPMSANDELAWTQPVLSLMREAVGRGVPVIGHCMGGQMLARALGAAVTANPVREIGWNALRSEDTPLARRWLGEDLREFVAFQWHAETFALPAGAERILTSELCANQAYVLDDRHLGMQCHVEMTEAMIESWLESGAGEVAAHRASPGVSAVAEIRAQMPRRLGALNAAAERLYGRWISGLA